MTTAAMESWDNKPPAAPCADIKMSSDINPDVSPDPLETHHETPVVKFPNRKRRRLSATAVPAASRLMN